MDQETIIDSSPIGKRLNDMMPNDTRMLIFGDRHIPMTGKLTLGRDPSCHVQVDNSLVSRKHALIQKIGDNYFITDLKSKNGTFVNGERVPAKKYVKLKSGDSIQIGKSVLVLQ
jgi:pSer/pThr/pTyr-binding forkhead associated (FHA) protein